ncbi:MAG TPA: hypothetical protein VK308_14150, partial [Pyrinomonadaceae bacterium]|nr:hypothetical protein [Pyrinomonadaceae bacterium]
TNENGAVFRYESIAKGAKFGSAIISETDELLDKILKLISDDGEIFVGGSRTGGYGKAKITGAKIEEGHEPQTKPAKELKENDVFTVTLLSHALVRDVNGQFGADVSAALNSFGILDKDKTYKKAEIVGGFNRKWGLPLPQVIAAKAGSVFTFKAARDISASEMQNLIDSGIGEKRLNGFGRIAVNLSRNDEFQFAEVEKRPNEILFSSIDLGSKILKQIVRQRMEKRLLDTLANHQATSVKIKEKISNSQISRLRLLLRRVLRKEKGVETIGEFFNGLKKTARDQFQSVRVSVGKNQGNLQHWIVESLDSLELFEKDIKINLGNNSGAVEADNKDKELQLEYHLHLIDGILARAAKENKQ